MSENAALVIRGGTILDGSGGDPIDADIAVSDGKITAIGANLPKGADEIDARGKLVTPGFVDVHTHYDAQATWSNRITPSSWNGVTTAMIGNCGVGFAPCMPDQRDMLVKLMEGVEDIPEVVLTEGLPWNWETFEDYLDALDARQYDLDIATQVPHAAVRVYVMGERALRHEPATAADRAAMAKIAAQGIRSGALGFSTSRTINHKTLAGEHTPTLRAEEDELVEIATAVGAAGSGWLQVISDFDDQDSEFAMLRRMVKAAGRPMTVTILQRDAKPESWRDLMGKIADANADDLHIFGQVLTRPTGIMLGFEISQNPFINRPSWDKIADLPFDEKLAILRQPDFRAQLISESNPDERLAYRVSCWERIFPLGDPPDYEPAPDQSIAALAAHTNKSPDEFAYDMLLEDGGKTLLYRPLSNYTYGDLETVKDMFSHPNSLVGLGDGGAHVSIISDASAFTYMLTHWTRDRTRGDKAPLPWAIKRMTRDNAAAIGLNDRGLLRPGYKADINVIDYDRLRLHAPKVAYDLPSGGRRLIQKADGYDATIVSGAPVQIGGAETGALPGRLVRGPHDAG
ncbi:MAG: amidohydrolase family protein [Rhodospirillaceae bacterium]|jgi:N-acyl-D-aspartate/D-glutamate deacylase|nr:amidohydrolase family protein [Rhodospirillaceae bacterium]